MSKELSPEQPKFLEKNMIVDAQGRVVPQYFDSTTQIFVPYADTNGGGAANILNVENALLGGGNISPYQQEFLDKNMIVDARGRPVPQYYDSTEKVFKPYYDTNSGGGGGTPVMPGWRHWYTTTVVDPVDPLRKVFVLDFDYVPTDFIHVIFNGETLAFDEYEIVEDATLGNYLRIITMRPFDYDLADVQGFLFRGFTGI